MTLSLSGKHVSIHSIRSAQVFVVLCAPVSGLLILCIFFFWFSTCSTSIETYEPFGVGIVFL